AEDEQPRRSPSLRGEITEAEEERQQEKADDGAVRIDNWLEAPETVDFLCRPSARVRTCSRGERTADDQQKPRRDERKPESPKLERNEWIDSSDNCPSDLECKHRRTGEEHDGEQQVNHDDRPAQVAGDGDESDRCLRERAEEDRERPTRAPA